MRRSTPKLSRHAPSAALRGRLAGAASAAVPIALQKILSTQIPLSKQMGIRVTACDETGVRFSLPLKPNRNHKMTAFGGTLVAAQALAAWSFLMQLLAYHGVQAEVVLQREQSEFLRPVAKNFTVATRPIADDDIERFIRTLQLHSKARLEVSARVLCGEEVMCEFSGQYVAIVKAAKKMPPMRRDKL